MVTIPVTYVNIRIKNYLKLLYDDLNSPQGEAVPYQTLANAIINFRHLAIKKLIKKDYSVFSITTCNWFSPIALMTQFILSPFSKDSVLITSLGIIDLSVDALGFGESTFVFISMTFILLNFVLFTILKFCQTFYKYFPIYLQKFRKYFPNIYIIITQ